jgi:hypothetical protein
VGERAWWQFIQGVADTGENVYPGGPSGKRAIPTGKAFIDRQEGVWNLLEDSKKIDVDVRLRKKLRLVCWISASAAYQPVARLRRCCRTISARRDKE